MAKVNIKNVLVEKGERYALYAAGGLMILLIVIGVINLADSPDPEAFVREVDGERNKITSQVNGGAAVADALPVWATSVYKHEQVALPWINGFFFDPIAPPDKRRINPNVLPVNDIQADFVWAKILAYDIDDGKIGVIVAKLGKGEAFNKDEQSDFVKKFNERNKRARAPKKKTNPQMGDGGVAGGMRGGPPGGMMGFPGGPGGMMGGPPGGMMGGPPGMAGMRGSGPGGMMGFPGGGMRGGPPGGMGGALGGGIKGMYGPGMGSGQGMYGNMMGMGAGNQSTVETGPREGVEYVPLDPEKLEGKRLALTIYPQRMVIIHAAFPYKAQVEEIQRALRLEKPELVFTTPDAIPAFRGYSIQRRIVPQGVPDLSPEEKERSWQDLDIEAHYRETIFPRSPADKEDDASLQYVMLPPEHELVMPLPALLSGNYPEVHLPAILETMKKLKELNKPPVQPKAQSQLKGEGSIYRPAGSSALNTTGQPNIGGKDGINIPKIGKPGTGGKDGDMNIAGSTSQIQFSDLPDACLIRIIDNDITPGYHYQYRIRVKMQNPNWAGPFDQKAKTYEKPEKLELVTRQSDAKEEMLPPGPWFEMKGDVSVPREDYLFATDPIPADPKEPTKKVVHLKPGQGLLQVQRWLPFATVGTFKEPVGDWIVADVLVRRGGYVGGKQFVNLPIWSSVYNRYILREVPAEKGMRSKEPRRGVVMDPTKPGPDYVVVEIEGGKQEARLGNRTVSEESASEILLMDSEGTLQVRSSAVDRLDKERDKREQAWRNWVEQTEKVTQQVVPGTKSEDKKGFE